MSDVIRESKLISRHHEIGVEVDEWCGMYVAQEYSTSADDEHAAVRSAAGLFDVSALKKIYVRGPDAFAVANDVTTRDMHAIPAGKSAYGPTLTDQGTICDDSIEFNLGNDEWLCVHGSGQFMDRLQESAEGKNVSIEFDDDLHDISLQGPKSVEVLNPHTPIDLDALEYFHHVDTELFGRPVLISRTGYSGERGFEIFARADHVGEIWDQILGHGEPEGVMAASFACLDKIRVEAALLFYPYDMGETTSPWEVGLGWTISQNADNYRGRDAALALRGNDKIRFAGIAVDHHEALEGDERLLLDGADVGVVNSPVYSEHLQKSLALVHLTPEAAVVGTELTVQGNVSCAAVVEATPWHDPQKTRTHA